jgi:signal peptidase I
MAAIPAHNGWMTEQIRAFWKWLAEPLAVMVLMFCATTAIAQPFYVPSGSMEPTLRIGDAMIASKFAYGYSAASLPVMLGSQDGPRLLGRLPKQGEVVIFRHPHDPRTVLVKRVIGLPGDRIRMDRGHLVINGRLLPLVETGMGEVEDRDGGKTPIRAFRETLPNGVSHPVYKRHWDGLVDDTAEITVPEGQLFVMGDNRDNSLDSRVAADDGGVGLVPMANLIGRAEFVLGSYDFLNMRGPASWPMLFRLRRFFQKIT